MYAYGSKGKNEKKKGHEVASLKELKIILIHAGLLCGRETYLQGGLFQNEAKWMNTGIWMGISA